MNCQSHASHQRIFQQVKSKWSYMTGEEIQMLYLHLGKWPIRISKQLYESRIKAWVVCEMKAEQSYEMYVSTNKLTTQNKKSYEAIIQYWHKNIGGKLNKTLKEGGIQNY